MKFFILSLVSSVLLFAQIATPDIYLTIKDKKPDEQIKLLINLCWENRSSNPRLAIKYGKKALEIIEYSGIDSLKSESFNFLGVVYGNIGDLDSAYYFYKNAYEISIHSKNKLTLAYSLNNLGDYYTKNALYSTALEKLFEGYKIFEELNEKRGMAYSLNDMGEIYLTQKDFDKALDHFERSSKLRYELKDDRGYAKSLLNLGFTYENLGQFDKALDNLNRAVELSKKISYKKGISAAYSGMSDVFFKQDRIEKSLEFRHLALSIDRQIENRYGEIVNENALGLLYLKTNNLAKAFEYLHQAEKDSRNTGHLDQLLDSYHNLTNYAVAINDFKMAYSYQKKYEELKEKIFGQESKNKIADLQTAFVVERKEKEAELLKLDLEYQKATRNYLILISILILGGVVLYVMKYKTEKKANHLLSELNESKDNFFSIIAHDLKNPIGAVSNLAELLKSDYDLMHEAERKELIDGISSASMNVQQLLMDLLTWARTQKGAIGVNKVTINLKNILESIVASYDLVAKNKRVEILINADPAVEIKADKLILQTIIGNFINNAIKFSFTNSKIIVDAVCSDNRVNISVEDFGIGMDEKTVNSLFKVDYKISTLGTNNERGTGMGLKICKEFAEIHKGKISVRSQPEKGSKFSFSFDNN
ncbi:MAG: tetratricopeptide repeat-containing sensor histidine kinase [Melioribacteraceae bacterium]|nr:tetratricopeptide repeat-containing sensor histidine kinase [Melioribacteraceae bacterium]